MEIEETSRRLSGVNISGNRLKGTSRYRYYNYLYIFANSEDPDEMPHNVAFHQGLHCL